MKILGISGSLRRDSTNSRLLRAAEALVPEGTTMRQFTGLGGLPHFNPDDDTDHPPAAVAAFRAEITWADALIISSPEYAHGVPGTLKNALDWLVGSGEIIKKPIALINASARSTYAHPQLAETLTVMSARVVPSASITIAVDGRRIDEHAMVADPEVSTALRRAIEEVLGSRHRRLTCPALASAHIATGS